VRARQSSRTRRRDAARLRRVARSRHAKGDWTVESRLAISRRSFASAIIMR
jgi:hypothetical protein